MQKNLRDSLVETLFDKFIDENNGEVPWFMVYTYLLFNPTETLYSFTSPVMYRTIRYINEDRFRVELRLNDTVIHADTLSCPYLAGEKFCMTKKLAKAKYEENNRSLTHP